MGLNYVYRKTARIKKYLQRLEITKKVIEILPKLPYIEENLRRKSLLKSSLYSARIEGNQLRLEDVEFLNERKKSEDTAKLEISNILKALRWIYFGKTAKKITQKLILRLHQFVLADISSSTGQFRAEVSAIFNQAGIAVYLAPPPTEILELIQQIIRRTNHSKEPGPIKAAVFHFGFEKIHPFLDGNGRVGRLLSTFILKQSGFAFRGLVSLEEHLEKNRQTYYDLLLLKQKDITEFVEFFLEAIAVQAEKAIENLKEIKEELSEDKLLPRRREILEIIRDHRTVSFNFIKRRFLKIPNSTLHYDLQQLLKDKFIKKLGSTRGTLYVTR